MSRQTKTPAAQATNQLASVSEVNFLSNEYIDNSIVAQIFFGMREASSWYVDPSTATSEIEPGKSLCLPLVMDTEFYQPPLHACQLSPRRGLTVQVASVNYNAPKLIYRHPDSSHLNNSYNYPVMQESAFVQYLRDCGYKATVEAFEGTEEQLKDLPTANLTIYGHFLTAELRLVFIGEFLKTIDSFIHEKSSRKARFECIRRLAAVTPTKGFDLDFIQLPYLLKLEDFTYKLTLTLIDTSAIIGIGSYADFCEVAGIKLKYKDTLEKSDKERMDLTFVSKPEAFHNYALGDLEVYQALLGYQHMSKILYDRLHIPEALYKIPRLTSGATVKNMFDASLQHETGFHKLSTEILESQKEKLETKLKAIAKQAGASMSKLRENKTNELFNATDKELQGLLTWEKFSERYLAVASASQLRLDANRTSALLSKVFGGRCRNNRPNFVGMGGAIADLDIGGAYAECQRYQMYGYGNPEVWDYRTSETEAGTTLRQWLKEYETDAKKYANRKFGELVPGLWLAHVTTRKPLSISQDFFSSWTVNSKHDVSLLAKYANKMNVLTDAEDDFSFEQAEFDEEDGSVKIFKQEILNAAITHDGLQWILHVCSPSQRDELLDNLFVVASVVYPKSEQVPDLQTFLDAHESWKQTTTNKRKRRLNGSRYIQTNDGQCHAWVGVPLTFVIDSLLANRKCFPKKTPMNDMFKLFANTLYGDMTSKFFDIANTTVGNNITARCRSLCWYMEKGLLGFQSITDGTAFDLNTVVYPKNGQRLYADKLMEVAEAENDRDRDRRLNIHLAPLAGYARIEVQLCSTWRTGDYTKAGKKDSQDRVLLVTKPDGTQETWLDTRWRTFVDNASMEHLQQVFPNVDVLQQPGTSLKPVIKEGTKDVLESIAYKERQGQFIFECKDVYTRIATHGAANYILFSGDHDQDPTVKMRSYRSADHLAYKLENDEPTVSTRKYKPALQFLSSLAHCPNAVPRGDTFASTSILKLGDVRQQSESLAVLGLSVGDSIMRPGLLREFSLSQFTFNTLGQYRDWEAAVSKDKELLGQSVERYFVNADGTLNYACMVATVAKMIRENVYSYRDYFNRRKVITNVKHPHHSTLEQVKSRSKQLT